jgi:hypothetical protein
MDYTEEREFTFRIQARVTFGEDYEGEEDGYAWAPELAALMGQMLSGMVQTASAAGWRVRPANRGRSTDEEVTLVLERTR